MVVQLLDAEHIGIVGHDLGATNAMVAAAQDARIKFVLALSPLLGQAPLRQLPLVLPLANRQGNDHAACTTNSRCAHCLACALSVVPPPLLPAAARSRVLCVAFLAGERAQSVGRTRVVRRWCHGPKPGVGPWVGRAVLSRTLGPYMTRYGYSRGALVAPACLWGRLPALAEALATEYAQRAGDARPTITCASWRGMPATLCITGEWDTTAPVMHGRSFFEQVGASACAPGGRPCFFPSRRTYDGKHCQRELRCAGMRCKLHSAGSCDMAWLLC